MKKLILFAFIAVALNAYSQKKTVKKATVWQYSGGWFMEDKKADTVIKNYAHIFRDSTSTEYSYDKVQGVTFSYPSKDGKLLYKPCDSLEERNLVTWNWVYEKSVTYVKGIKTSETKPKFRKSTGTGVIRVNEYNGVRYPGQSFTSSPREFFYNKKRVYPVEIFTKPKIILNR